MFCYSCGKMLKVRYIEHVQREWVLVHDAQHGEMFRDLIKDIKVESYIPKYVCMNCGAKVPFTEEELQCIWDKEFVEDAGAVYRGKEI